jgi:predicted metal-dependent enzyme (double-stranded beta helix superfamily)
MSYPRPDEGLLAVIAAGLASSVTPDDLPLAPGQERDFVRLLVTPDYEAWLIAWAPSSALELHDHGGAAGAFHLASGRLRETYVDPAGHDGLRTRTVLAGAGVRLSPERIHEVWNPGPGRALSVHVYAPALTSMTFYDRDLHPTRVSRGDVVSLERAS